MTFYDDFYSDYNINNKNNYINSINQNIYKPTSIYNGFQQPVPDYSNFGIIANTPNIPEGLEAFLITDFIEQEYD